MNFQPLTDFKFFISLKDNLTNCYRAWTEWRKQRKEKRIWSVSHQHYYVKIPLSRHDPFWELHHIFLIGVTKSQRTSPWVCFETLFIRGMSAEHGVLPLHSSARFHCFPAQPQSAFCCSLSTSDGALMRTLLVERAGSIINLLSPNCIFSVSPGTGDSPITDLISDLCRWLFAPNVHWIAFSIE